MVDGIQKLHLIEDCPRRSYRVSDHQVVECIGARFARSPLSAAQLRDAKLVAFVLDLLSQVADEPAQVSGRSMVEAVVRVSGVPAARVEWSLEVLRQSGVLEEGAAGLGAVVFCNSTLVPLEPSCMLDWTHLVPVLRGRMVMLLILCACVDLIPVPWEWTSLTHSALMLHACYSIGMVQLGLAHLVKLGVIERVARAGRGHDYRFSAWALGRGPMPKNVPDQTEALVSETYSSLAGAAARRISESAGSGPGLSRATEGAMTVEIGGLVLRLPVGTEITMTIGTDGTTAYAVGPDLVVRW